MAVDFLENVFRTSFVGIRQRAAADLEGQTDMVQFPRLSEQGRGYLPQRVEPHDYGIQHHHQMNPDVEAFRVTFSTVLPADLKDF